jgi:hypothetical protein
MSSNLRSASLLTAAAVFMFLLPAADGDGCGDGDVIIGDDAGGSGPGGAGSGGDGDGGTTTNPCIITGCSSQVCSDMEVATTCEYLPEYNCYATFGTCEPDTNDVCGWSQTTELTNCLANVAFCPGPEESCMNAMNHQECLTVASSCGGSLAILESCPLQFACE